jgi:transposase
MASKQEEYRNRVVQFYISHPNEPKIFTANHFKAEGKSVSGVYKIINTYERRKTTKRLKEKQRKPNVMTKKKQNQLKSLMNHKDKVSISGMARKFKTSRTTIKTWLKKFGIKRYKKQKSPKYTEEGMVLAQKQCRWLYRKFLSTDFVIDDEKYFKLTGPGDEFFFSSSPQETTNSVKYKGKRKFEPKIMLWIAISKNGMSKPYFQKGGLAVDNYVYWNKCLKPKLLPFIQQHHQDGNYIFLPDKASWHYSNYVIEELGKHGVKYVTKYRNPTNVPQCRPIEDFFGYLQGLVYENGWEAENLQQLERRIVYCLKKVDLNVVQRSMNGVSKRLRKAADHGVLSVCH